MNLFNDYASYLKSKHGCRVYKIGLDAGFSCPNRDGTKGSGGCIYCNSNGSRSAYADPCKPIKEQLASRIEYLKRSRSAQKFIAYFQAFTNTHASVDVLKRVYDQIRDFSEIVGLSIGTRPDAVDDDKLRLVASYMDRYALWLELGLQSVHNRTLDLIKRGHTFEDFRKTFEAAGKLKIPVCAHLILGLPGETREDMLATARMMTELRVGAVKIHLLHILKGSALEEMYKEGKVPLMEQAEYVELVCDFLEELSPDIIIQRLTAQGDRASHIAPAWAMDKSGTINRICETLKKRGTCQGSRLQKTVRS